VPVRILTDEHISPTVARDLYALGHDVIPVHDRGLLGKKDWELMAWCIKERRAICTVNGDDLEREHRRCRARGEDHYGVLVVGDWLKEEICWALLQYLESGPDPDFLVNQVIEIPPASAEFVREYSDRHA
jgi:predicted nuclease of predicted toxin-antitoxin system